MRKRKSVSLSVGRGEKSKKGGLTAKGRAKYNRATGSNLQAPVTEKNPTGKRAARRKSFCARMSGMPGPCLLYTSPSPRDPKTSRMPSSA